MAYISHRERFSIGPENCPTVFIALHVYYVCPYNDYDDNNDDYDNDGNDDDDEVLL